MASWPHSRAITSARSRIEEQTNLNLLTGLTSQLDAASQALARAQQDKTFAQSMLTQQIASWRGFQNGAEPGNDGPATVRTSDATGQLKARYTDDYPDVIKAKADIEALQKKIADSDSQKAATEPGKDAEDRRRTRRQITQLRAQIHTYDQVIAEKTKEQEQIKQQIKMYRGPGAIQPGRGAAIQGIDARLSDGARVV